ncbi:xanthine dehydrogenase family protein molybdopterin-binding subunit [Amaricoccus solimangrovi]|uniref:Xanthine dehydrogenase family protein molybdopterin-binding subunit n=1 Tax=Amaricoccus solimangrovi TaxID=2589815 RepID=A0A501X178_9RHOB|nr:molybdopterin cofactor-binding domain-containing protein [Amaricoccus solimangrovi]TPE53256.1 xanthine dehydrogenase family protein molybdopterin-binding subunit [Amaricoccus solimangrovi]
MAEDPMVAPMNAPRARVSRRCFLIAMCASGAVFGFPRASGAAMNPGALDGLPVAAAGARFEPTIWYWIDASGAVNVKVIRAEMGQHIGTAIARILADELGANWDDVHVEHVDSDAKWGMMVTGGSTSVWESWPVYREAGAAGRVALARKAAEIWGIDPASVTVENGVVSGGGRSAGFGELVAGGIETTYTEEELDALPLRPRSEMRLIGKDLPALDIAPKTTGQAIYGIDARVEGMVHAVPILPPTRYGCAITAIDESGAAGIGGYRRTLRLDDASGTVPGWAMVIADTHWAALRAAERIKVSWSTGEAVNIGEAELQAENRRLIEDPAAGALLDTGDDAVDPVFAAAADTLEADYTTQTVLHFQMEPSNALAFRNADGIWEIHTGCQWQSLCLPWIQTALGVGDGEVVMRTYLLGGGFGRRLNGDYAVPAALASKMLDDRPVKMVLTRPADTHFDSVRSPSMARMRMAFDAEKKVTAMDAAVVAGWPTKPLVPAFMPPGVNGVPYDPFSTSGIDHWYEVGAQRARTIPNELAEATFRPGWLRAVGPGWINFSIESFMDEAARHIGVDPVRFRLDHLTAEGRNAGSAPNAVGGAARQAAVLRRVAEISGHGTADLPADTAIGVATTFGQMRAMPTWVGTAARVHVDRKTGAVELGKLWLVVDCGTVIDPDGARAQIEGAALWGVSMALREGTRFVGGRVADSNLDTYTPLRMEDTPEVEIELVDSAEAPVGLGEPGVTAVAPAIANAIFAAVGVRVRHLPITAEAIRDALGA